MYIIQGVFFPSFSIQKLRVKSELAQVLKHFERSYLIMRLAWAQQQQQLAIRPDFSLRRLTSLALGAVRNGATLVNLAITSQTLSDRNRIVSFLFLFSFISPPGGICSGIQSPRAMVRMCKRKSYHFVHARSNWSARWPRKLPSCLKTARFCETCSTSMKISIFPKIIRCLFYVWRKSRCKQNKPAHQPLN